MAEQELQYETIEDEAASQISGSTDISVDRLSDSAFYRMYLNEVRAKESVSEEQQRALYERLLAGDEAASSAIVDGWLMRIVELAKLYKDAPVHIEDVIQEGNMGLWVALTSLPDGLTAERMDVFLAEKVKESMENYIRETAGEIDREQSVVGKAELLYSAREHLAKENGETPSNRQLSEFTHIPVEEIEDILALMKEEEQ